MNEKIESIKKYNLWFGNTIDCGFPRPLYTSNIHQYLGNKVIKVLTGQRRVGKSYILRQTAMQLLQQGVKGNNIVFINRELTAYDLTGRKRQQYCVHQPRTDSLRFYSRLQRLRPFHSSVSSGIKT